MIQKQKTVGGAPATAASNPNAPPGQRTSPQLERYKDAKAKLESGQLDFNALDKYVNFKDSHQSLDGLIGQIQGTPGSVGDYAAQATRVGWESRARTVTAAEAATNSAPRVFTASTRVQRYVPPPATTKQGHHALPRGS